MSEKTAGIDKPEFYKFLILVSLAADKFELIHKDIIQSEIKAIRAKYEAHYYPFYEAAANTNLSNEKKQAIECGKVTAKKTREINKAIADVTKSYHQFLKITRAFEKGFSTKNSKYLEGGKKYLLDYIDKNIRYSEE